MRVFDRMSEDSEKLEVAESIADRVKFCTFDDLLLMLSKFEIPEFRLKALRYLQYCPATPLPEKTKKQIVDMFELQANRT